MKELLADSGAAFYTTGDGLRGAPVLLIDRDTGELLHSRVYSNTATSLWLDVPVTREPDQYDLFVVGSVPMTIESGDLTFGNPRVKKYLKFVTVEYERGAKGQLAFYLLSDPTSQTKSNWQFEGLIPLTGQGWYRLSLNSKAQSGRVLRYQLISTVPGQPVSITHLSFSGDYGGAFE